MADTFNPLSLAKAALDLDAIVSLVVAAARRRARGSLRARGARPGGVPGLRARVSSGLVMRPAAGSSLLGRGHREEGVPSRDRL
jgi:hypothetical protein